MLRESASHLSSSKMSDEQLQRLREHALRCERLGPELERIRLKELAGVNGIVAIGQLLPAFELAAKLPPRATSGLIEQQAIFKKLHPKS
jgi:hypothetical protein